MARSVVAAGVSIVVVLGGAILWRSCRQAESRIVLKRWLTQDCSAGEAEDGEAQLRAQGRRLEQALIDAFQQGPSTAEIDVLLAAAGQDYDEVQAALNAGKSYGLSSQDVAAIRAISKTEHLAGLRAGYDYDYRAAVLAGLGVAGGDNARKMLRQIAADPQSPYRHWAEVALKRLQ